MRQRPCLVLAPLVMLAVFAADPAAALVNVSGGIDPTTGLTTLGSWILSLVPFWFILPIVGLPMVIVSVTRNPFWLLTIAGLTLLGRWLVSRDHNRPRVLFLALISGAMFADRRRWGGDSTDPLGAVRRDDRILRVDRHTRRFAPILGHWNDSIFVNQDGSVGVIYHLNGLAAELAGGRAISAAHLSLNQLDRSIAQPRIEWWDHSVRQDGQAMSALPAVDNWFAARFDEAYRATQGDGKLFRNAGTCPGRR